MKTARDKKQLNGKEGMAMMKGSWTPQQQWAPQRAPRRRPKRCKNHITDSLLESRPFSVMVWDWECSKSEDKWGKLHGPLGQWCPGKYHHAKVHKQSFTTSGTNYQPHGFQSHLCRARQCLHKTIGLCSDLGLGRQSLGLQWGSDSPSNPRPFQFHGQSPSFLRDAHYWPSSQCNERGGDWCLSNAMGEC